MLKCQYCPKQPTGLLESLQKSQSFFFAEIEKTHPKMYMASQGTSNSHNNFDKAGQTTGLKHSDFKIYSKATLNKAVWYWGKDRPVDQ